MHDLNRVEVITRSRKSGSLLHSVLPSRVVVRENEKEDEMLDQKQMATQIIKFNKTVWDNTFNACTVLQEQSEKLMIAWMQQNPLLPTEGKAAITDWLKACKKGCVDYKAATDESYKRVEEFFGEFAKGKKG